MLKLPGITNIGLKVFQNYLPWKLTDFPPQALFARRVDKHFFPCRSLIIPTSVAFIPSL